VCLVYDHHVPDLAAKLTRIQHEVGKQIISALHVHLDHRNCLEVIVLRGQASRLRQIADQLASTRGVKYGKLMMASTGRDLA
jgi:CopG family nickel-responsive transcriptional regulator